MRLHARAAGHLIHSGDNGQLEDQMPHYGTLSNYAFSEQVDDVRGATLYGLEDEKIGKIDDVIFDHTSGQIRYAVVDSGGWLKSKKFLIPADRIATYPKSPDDFVIGITKHQIESFPPYDEKKLGSEADWKRYEDDYKRSWHEAPVQHQHGTDRNITPAEPVGAPIPRPSTNVEGEVSGADLTPQRLSGKFPSAEPSGQKLTMRPAGTAERAEEASYGTVPLSGRWGALEEHLRRNRVDIQARCSQCEPAMKKDVA